MATHVEPTAEQWQAAFERMRGPEWPDTLHDLLQATARMGIVTSAARALARGERVDQRNDAAAPLPVRTFEHPARRDGARPFPTRRRDDQAVDLKSRAAGEKPEQE